MLKDLIKPLRDDLEKTKIITNNNIFRDVSRNPSTITNVNGLMDTSKERKHIIANMYCDKKYNMRTNNKSVSVH